MAEDAHAQATDEVTPLHRAAWADKTALVRIFLEHGADASVQNKGGWTALYWAAEAGHTEIVNLLRRYWATEF